ncbi:hypothetical protein ACFQ1S_02075, partial [Kibdelosporangium lantanae]
MVELALTWWSSGWPVGVGDVGFAGGFVELGDEFVGVFAGGHLFAHPQEPTCAAWRSTGAPADAVAEVGCGEGDPGVQGAEMSLFGGPG